MQHYLTTILALTAFVAVCVALIMAVIAVAVSIAFINRDKPDEDEKPDTSVAASAMAMADMSGIHDLLVSAAQADKVNRAMAEAYTFGMSVCAEIKATRGIDNIPVWTPAKFYEHRMSHEIEACRANPNLDGAALVKATDARVRDDLWHHAPMPVEAYIAPENVTRKLDVREEWPTKPDWRDPNVRNENGYRPGDMQEQTPKAICRFPGCDKPKAVDGEYYCLDHYKMLADELAENYSKVHPRKPRDAREAMLFGDGKEE